MKVYLTRNLHIGKDYFKAGEQEIADSVLKSEIFAKHIQAGNILDVSHAPKKVVAPTLKQRADSLLEKIHGEKANATPEEAAKLSGGVKSESEVSDEAEESSKHGKSKHKK